MLRIRARRCGTVAIYPAFGGSPPTTLLLEPQTAALLAAGAGEDRRLLSRGAERRVIEDRGATARRAVLGHPLTMPRREQVFDSLFDVWTARDTRTHESRRTLGECGGSVDLR